MLRGVNPVASIVIPVGLALGLALGLVPSSAHACSCRMPSFEDQRAAASAIFEGRVEAIEPVEGGELRVRFHVTQAWRGVEHESVEVQTASNGAACGFTFEVGQHYLVYAGQRDQTLMVSLCSRTARMDDASEDRQLLGSGTVPVDVVDEPEPQPREAPATRAGCASCGVATSSAPGPLALALALGALALGAFWRARSARR